MTTPTRPEYIRITGPVDAFGVTVGRVYLVVNWHGTAPFILDDNNEKYIMAISGDASGARIYPAWVPCGPPPTIEALKAEGDALRAENAALRAEVASGQAANAALKEANEAAASLTTTGRPKWVRITGPANAFGITVGQAYRVLGWSGTVPFIRNDDGCYMTLGPASGDGSWLYPTWEPCVGPAGEEAS